MTLLSLSNKSSLIISIFILLTASFVPFISNTEAVNQVQIGNQRNPIGNDWWDTFHHDLLHTGFSTSTAPENNQVLWSYQTSDVFTSSPVVSHGRVYAGSWDYNLYCLDMDNGNLFWNYTTDSLITTTPTVENGRVYFGSQDSYLYCLNSLTGDLVWRYKANYMVESSPAIKYGKVFFGSNEGILYCLDADDGSIIWTYPTQNVIWSSPVVTEDYVYFGNLNGIFYCLNVSTGDQIWIYSIDTGIWSSPALDEGKIYFGGNDFNIYCLNAYTGSLVWNYTTLSEVHSSPAIAYDNVYIGSNEGVLYCLDKDTGAFLWNYTVNGGIKSSPSVADGKIYFGNDPCCGNPSFLYCLDAYNGSLIWDYNFQSIIGMKSSPAISASKVFVTAGDGKVISFGEIEYIADANGPYFGQVNDSVDFMGSVYGGEPDFTWYWEFGDGATSTEQNPTHVYEQTGVYDVSLTVTDNNDLVAVDQAQAFIQVPNRPPSIPEISGPTSGKIGVEYTYYFVSTDDDSDGIYYYVQWGDSCSSEDYVGPYPSGEVASVNHTYGTKGTYTMYAKAIDVHDAESDWATFEVTMPRTGQIITLYHLIENLLNRFPHVFPIIRYLIEL